MVGLTFSPIVEVCGAFGNFFLLSINIVFLMMLGFLGLLMGGSLISLIEIIYHFVLRPIIEKTEKPPMKRENEPENSKTKCGGDEGKKF